MEENVKQEVEMGIVKISDEVVGIIAGLAAAEVKGIVGLNETLVGGITQKLSVKKGIHSKGVKVNVGEDSASIDIYVIVEYGVKIPDIALLVQENVKKTVESMTGLNVSAVNIFVQNVIFPNIKKSKEKVEQKED